MDSNFDEAGYPIIDPSAIILGINYNRYSVSKVNIKNGVMRIKNATFYDCKKLSMATIPSSVLSIEDNDFWQSESLQSIIIPDSLTSIAEGAFESCGSLYFLHNNWKSIQINWS